MERLGDDEAAARWPAPRWPSSIAGRQSARTPPCFISHCWPCSRRRPWRAIRRCAACDALHVSHPAPLRTRLSRPLGAAPGLSIARRLLCPVAHRSADQRWSCPPSSHAMISPRRTTALLSLHIFIHVARRHGRESLAETSSSPHLRRLLALSHPSCSLHLSGSL